MKKAIDFVSLLFVLACNSSCVVTGFRLKTGFPEEGKKALHEDIQRQSSEDYQIVSTQKATAHEEQYDEVWCVAIDKVIPIWCSSHFLVRRTELFWGVDPIYDGNAEQWFLERGCTNWQ